MAFTLKQLRYFVAAAETEGCEMLSRRAAAVIVPASAAATK